MIQALLRVLVDFLTGMLVEISIIIFLEWL